MDHALEQAVHQRANHLCEYCRLPEDLHPGSFEVGFFDAQPSSGIPLIMGLHEGLVVAMADGYHRVSGKTAFVNVHVVAGTAQMMGQIYNASRDGSSMVITSGLLDNEVWSDEGQLAPHDVN